jgi:arylsulfate sulfotransferase
MRFAKHVACLCTLGSALAVSACGSSSGGSSLSIQSIQLTQSVHCVLAYKLEVKTNANATLSVTVTPKDTSVQPWTVTSTSPASKDNIVAIAGMRANKEYDLKITASGDSGSATDNSQKITTDQLPSDLPPIKKVAVDSSKMAPGFTYFGVITWLPSGQPAASGWLVMLDNEGNIVWYYQTPSYPGGGWGGGPQDVRLLPDGNVGYGHEGSIDGFTEVDPLGNTVKSWVATGMPNMTAPAGTIPVNIDSMHHAAYPLPNGDFLTLTSELRNTGSQNCASATQNFVGDDAVEFKPDGTVVKKVSEFDILDPCRKRTAAQLQLDYATGYWNAYYGGITTQDWTHSNAVVYDQPRGLAIVSVRHQDVIIGIDWKPGDAADTGKVAWLFGDEENPGDFSKYPHFTSTGTPFGWTYHQHGVVVFDNGDLGAFDNGNLRPGTDPSDPNNLPYSRVVEFSLDTTNMTTQQVWEYKAPDPYRSGGVMYCPFFGIVQKLSNGDMLADFGGGVEPPSDAIKDPSERKFAQIVEVEPQSNNKVVFDVQVKDPAQTNFTGYSVYRARRITGFLRQVSDQTSGG